MAKQTVFESEIGEQQKRRQEYAKEREDRQDRTVGARLGGVAESKREPSQTSRGTVLTKRQINNG